MTAYSNPNMEMVDAAKAVKICRLCFSCCWTALLLSKLFLQLSFWRLKSVEDFPLQRFQLHRQPYGFICKDMQILKNYSVQSSDSFFGIYNHLNVLIFHR